MLEPRIIKSKLTDAKGSSRSGCQKMRVITFYAGWLESFGLARVENLLKLEHEALFLETNVLFSMLFLLFISIDDCHLVSSVHCIFRNSMCKPGNLRRSMIG